MMNSKEQQMPLNGELPTLTDYHWQRSADAQKAIEEMSKHPSSWEERIARNKVLYQQSLANREQRLKMQPE